MTQDRYFGSEIGIGDPSNEAYAVVPHASDALPNGVPKALWIGTAGNLTVKLPDSETDVIYKNIPAGTWMPIRPTHVRATSTAADIIANYLCSVSASPSLGPPR